MHACIVRITRLVAFVAAMGASSLAFGQATPTLVGQFGDWGVYTSQTAGGKVCYALSQPKTRAPEGLNRDPAYFFISTRPGESVKNEVSVIVGFPMKDGSEATLTIGPASFALYTRNDGAWVRNVAEETRLVDAMRRGKDVSVKSSSKRGNVTTDSYSLSGVGAALDRVTQECR